MADIFVFSDSVGYGAWDEKGGWVDRLKQYFMQQKLAHPQSPSIEVVNLAVDGDTSADVAARIKNELTVRRKPWSTDEDLVIVAIGTNDAYAEGSPANFISTPDDYKANLTKISQAILELKLTPLFISLDPVNENQTTPCSWGSYYWTNNRISEFNAVQNEFCNHNNIQKIDLFEAFLNHPEFEKFLFDGVHPNSEGHEWIYEQIKPTVLELLN